MRIRCFIIFMLVAGLILISPPAMADDLADLKATHQQYDKAWNTGDVAGAFEIWQDGGIWVPTSYAFPIVTNSALGMQMFTRWLEGPVFLFGPINF